MKIPKSLPNNSNYLLGVSARPEVHWFAYLMEQKLSKFDTSRNWDDARVDYLLGRAHDEFTELLLILKARIHIDPVLGGNRTRYTIGDSFNKEAVIEECVDMANFCMMIADTCRKAL